MKYILTFVIFFIVGFVGLTLCYERLPLSNILSPASTSKKIQLSVTPTFAPFNIDIPPTNSLKGTVTTMTGKIELQSRTASEAAVLTKPKEVLQGEIWATSDSGTLEISFNTLTTLSFSKDTKIEFLQTLPNHFVLNQSSGEVLYSTDDIPLSVRTRKLIAELQKASATIAINDETGKINISTHTGSVNLAFNDTDFVTQSVTVQAGQTYIFDTASRTGVFEK